MRLYFEMMFYFIIFHFLLLLDMFTIPSMGYSLSDSKYITQSNYDLKKSAESEEVWKPVLLHAKDEEVCNRAQEIMAIPQPKIKSTAANYMMSRLNPARTIMAHVDTSLESPESEEEEDNDSSKELIEIIDTKKELSEENSDGVKYFFNIASPISTPTRPISRLDLMGSNYTGKLEPCYPIPKPKKKQKFKFLDYDDDSTDSSSVEVETRKPFNYISSEEIQNEVLTDFEMEYHSLESVASNSDLLNYEPGLINIRYRLEQIKLERENEKNKETLINNANQENLEKTNHVEQSNGIHEPNNKVPQRKPSSQTNYNSSVADEKEKSTRIEENENSNALHAVSAYENTFTDNKKDANIIKNLYQEDKEISDSNKLKPTETGESKNNYKTETLEDDEFWENDEDSDSSIKNYSDDITQISVNNGNNLEQASSEIFSMEDYSENLRSEISSNQFSDVSDISFSVKSNPLVGGAITNFDNFDWLNSIPFDILDNRRVRYPFFNSWPDGSYFTVKNQVSYAITLPGQEDHKFKLPVDFPKHMKTIYSALSYIPCNNGLRNALQNILLFITNELKLFRAPATQQCPSVSNSFIRSLIAVPTKTISAVVAQGKQKHFVTITPKLYENINIIVKSISLMPCDNPLRLALVKVIEFLGHELHMLKVPPMKTCPNVNNEDDNIINQFQLPSTQKRMRYIQP